MFAFSQASYFVLGLIRNVYGLMLGSLILAMGIGMLMPTIYTMAVNIVNPRNRGTCTALVYTGFDIGSSSGAYIFGSLADVLDSYGLPYLAFAFIETIAIFIFVYVTSPVYKKGIEEIKKVRLRVRVFR